MYKLVLAAVTVGTLAACGGSGGSNDGTASDQMDNPQVPTPPTTPTPPMTPSGPTTNAAFQMTVDDLNALDTAGPGNVTLRDTLRAQGAVTYEGFMTFHDQDDTPQAADMVADVELLVNFDDTEVSGTASNFVRRDGVTFNGSINTTRNSIFTNDDGGAMFIDIIGRLPDANGNIAEIDATLLSASAFGDDAEQIRGTVFGEYEYMGVEYDEDGTFVIEK